MARSDAAPHPRLTDWEVKPVTELIGFTLGFLAAWYSGRPTGRLVARRWGFPVPDESR